MHTAIDLDMHGVLLQTATLYRFAEEQKHGQGIDIRLQVVIQNNIHRCLFGVHNDDRQVDTGAAQLGPFVSNSYGKIICHTRLLQSTAHLHTTCSVRKSLYHADQLGIRLQERTVGAYIIGKGSQVNLHNRLMRLTHDSMSNGILVIPQRTHHGGTGAHILVRLVLNDYGATPEQAHLLGAFLLQGLKLRRTLRTNKGHHADGRTDNLLQFIHFARSRNSGLKDTQFGILVHLPYGERHTYLRVIRTGRARDAEVIFEQFVQPLLHHGLAMRAGDGDNRTVAFLPFVGGERLKGGDAVTRNKNPYPTGV